MTTSVQRIFRSAES